DRCPTGQPRYAAGTAHAGEVAGFAQLRIGGADGGAADLQRGGEVAFGRDAGAQLDAAVNDEQADAVGESEIGRRSASPPIAEEGGERASRQGRHRATLGELDS